MAYIIPDALRDRENDKFINSNSTGSECIKVALFALSGTTWLPVKCLSDGTLVTSGA